MFFYTRNARLTLLRLKTVRNNHTAANKMTDVSLKSKFQGCLMGALVGDCLGAPFEGDPLSRGAAKIVQNYFDKLEEPDIKGRKQMFRF